MSSVHPVDLLTCKDGSYRRLVLSFFRRSNGCELGCLLYVPVEGFQVRIASYLHTVFLN